eukprot:373807-Rhodomonas_salina.1
MSGTDIAHGLISLRACYAISGTDTAYSAISCYEMPGADIVCGAILSYLPSLPRPPSLPPFLPFPLPQCECGSEIACAGSVSATRVLQKGHASRSSRYLNLPKLPTLLPSCLPTYLPSYLLPPDLPPYLPAYLPVCLPACLPTYLPSYLPTSLLSPYYPIFPISRRNLGTIPYLIPTYVLPPSYLPLPR